MHFCCIVVAKKGKKIVIKFDVCGFNNPVVRKDRLITDILLENAFYAQQQEVIDCLNRKNISSEIDLTYHQQNFSAMTSSTVYTLPTESFMAVDLLNCIDAFIHYHQFDNVQVVNKSFLKAAAKKGNNLFLNGLENRITEGAVNLAKSSPAKQVAKAILALDCGGKYADVKAELKRYLNGLFPPTLEINEGRLMVCRFYAEPPCLKQFLKIQKLMFAQMTAQSFKQFNSIVTNYNAWVKNKWLAQCLGKEAHAGLYYGSSYSEIVLLRECDYVLQSDGRMSANIGDTSVFKNCYAKDKKYHNLLQDELKHLAPILGIKFSPDTDFSEKLIFTPACSKRLMELGLHLNVGYLKKYIMTKNSYQGMFKHVDGMTRHLFPVELVDKIASVASGIDELCVKDRMGVRNISV